MFYILLFSKVVSLDCFSPPRSINCYLVARTRDCFINSLWLGQCYNKRWMESLHILFQISLLYFLQVACNISVFSDLGSSLNWQRNFVRVTEHSIYILMGYSAMHICRGWHMSNYSQICPSLLIDLVTLLLDLRHLGIQVFCGFNIAMFQFLMVLEYFQKKYSNALWHLISHRHIVWWKHLNKSECVK